MGEGEGGDSGADGGGGGVEAWEGGGEAHGGFVAEVEVEVEGGGWSGG